MTKRVLVVGGGESGVGAARLANKMKSEVLLTEYNTIADKYKKILRDEGIPFEEKGHSFEKFEAFDLVVKSPGIPDSTPVIQYFINRDVEVISEIEYGSRYYEGIVLAITGSNGKTTVTSMLYHLLHTAGYDVEVGGNIGVSFCNILCNQSPAYMVLEVSSFQLDNCYTFQPKVSTILNITADHLDRYNHKLEEYAAAKFRIGQNLGSEDVIFLNKDDHWSVHYNTLPAESTEWITRSSYKDGVTSKDGDLIELQLKGKHNQFNAHVAAEMARAVGVEEQQIKEGLSSFGQLAHRMEVVAHYQGVAFINDSKATNVDSTLRALEGISGPIIWVAGGVDKGNDYAALLPQIDKVKALICLGVDNEKLKKFFTPHLSIILETTKVSEVLNMAQEIMADGDTVLLSPACASFDLFTNYIDRGKQYKEAVTELIKKDT